MSYHLVSLTNNKDCPTNPLLTVPNPGMYTLRPLHDVQERSNAWIMIVAAAAQRLIPQRFDE
jgi:hypothetical protein